MNGIPITLYLTPAEVEHIRQAGQEADEKYNATIEHAAIRKILAHPSMAIQVSLAVRHLQEEDVCG